MQAQLKEAPAQPRRGGLSRRLVKVLGATLLFCTLAAADGCPVTVFQSNFDNDAIGGPPASAQPIGTASVLGDPGAVVVVGPPTGTSGNWVQITRASVTQSAVETLRCSLTQGGQGTFTLTAQLFIPSGAGLASVGFMSMAGSQEFMHLDFQQDGTVRVDDDSSKVFGSFPHGMPFTLQVVLTITGSQVQADITLFGSSTSGSFTAFNSTPIVFAQSFDTIDFFMGFPWTGSFDVQGILVDDTPPSTSM